jgi:hypothetical protein
MQLQGQYVLQRALFGRLQCEKEILLDVFLDYSTVAAVVVVAVVVGAVGRNLELGGSGGVLVILLLQ